VPELENQMSRINGEKARAAIAKRARTTRRAKDRARRAATRPVAATQTESSGKQQVKA
jgi:hypothetical protein